MTKNKIFFEKETGIIWNVYHGDQDKDTISQAVNETVDIIKKNNIPKENVFVAVDLSDHGNTTTGSRKAATEALKEISYNKIAIFGLDAYMRNVAKFIINAINKDDSIRVFDTKEEAIDWIAN